MHKRAEEKDNGLKIAGLIINLIFIPGLGTIIAGDKKKGIPQIILWLIGVIGIIVSIPLMFLLIGFITMPISICLWFSAWVWALITSIKSL